MFSCWGLRFWTCESARTRKYDLKTGFKTPDLMLHWSASESGVCLKQQFVGMSYYATEGSFGIIQNC